MRTDHIRMLYDIAELNSLFSESMSIDSFLAKAADMVADHMHAQVCSIYLYDDEDQNLVLRGTHGLNQSSVGTIQLKTGEGIAGYSLEIMEPVCEECGKNNPHFVPVSDIQEELYESYLAVPIKRGAIPLGVIVVQREKTESFSDEDIFAMRAMASQFASIIENVKILLSPEHMRKRPVQTFDFAKYKFIKGKSASQGFSHNKALVLNTTSFTDTYGSAEFKTELTLKDFEEALLKTERELEELQQKVEEQLSDAASLIFGAHLLMLKDNGFAGGMRKLIEEGVNPPVAVIKIYTKYREIFSKSPTKLLQEKIQDIEDLSQRLIDNLLGTKSVSQLHKGQIVIARELYPSGLLKLSAEGVSGIILVSGGVTSHVGILARSLNLPLVIANVPALLFLPEKTEVLVDGEQGNLYIEPPEDVIKTFQEHSKAKDALLDECEYFQEPSKSLDGKRIQVMLNINLLSDAKQADFCEIDGVGLYRTEFPFLIRNDFPSEEEQYYIYRKLVESMQGKRVIFRTLDIGGDKVLSYYDSSNEENPFLGMRSIRFSLTHSDLFKQQIRAILRASYDAEIGIMFPMISSVDEFIEAKSYVFECVKELQEREIECNIAPDIGMMVEIPSAIAIIEELAEEAHFFSVGTNDLIQYILAVDRTNEKVSDLYIPHHPAVLKSLQRIIRAANKAGIYASICGDMANNIKYVPLLLGMGYKAFSVDGIFIPKVKRIVTETSIEKAEAFADKMLTLKTIRELNEFFIDSENSVYS